MWCSMVEYMGFVLPVHGFCTPRTWALYSEYMGFVLWHGPRGVDVSSVFLRREGAGLPSLIIAAGEINLCHMQCFGKKK